MSFQTILINFLQTRSMAMKSLCCIHFVMDGHHRTKLLASTIIHGTFIWTIILDVVVALKLSLSTVIICWATNQTKKQQQQ